MSTGTSRELRIGAHLAQHVDTRAARQHRVEDDESRRSLAQPLERGLAVGDLVTVELVTQRHDDELAQRLLVFDDQNARPRRRRIR